MQTIPTLLIACAAAAATFSSSALAEGSFVPGALETEAQLKQVGKHYQSVLLSYFFEYGTALINGKTTCYGIDVSTWKGLPVEEARQRIITRIKEHPEEVNDAGYQDGESNSALNVALSHRDVELVKLLLEYEAIPYKPGYNGSLCLYTSELVKIIEEARKDWPEVEKCPNPFEKLRQIGKKKS